MYIFLVKYELGRGVSVDDFKIHLILLLIISIKNKTGLTLLILGLMRCIMKF
jgi:hypothetical protein